MPEMIVRPTKKWVSFNYTVSLIVIFVVVFAANNYLTDWWAWSLAVSALVLLWPISLDIRQRFTKILISGDKLRYESGLLSKNIRTIPLSKVQDVSVNQTLRQRLTGTGDLTIETAGDTSRVSISNIDRPQAVAEEIMGAVQSFPAKRKGERG
jgi:uncharacterized membrane protein YdbT with pleckstrin-like domain